MSNVGRWDRWYAGLTEEQPYGLTSTYQLGADFLAGCATIEDWGCGKGWMRTLVEPGRYRGIDGSWSPFADEVVDLVAYRSCVDGIFMRHVLEHNYEWQAILANAMASFTHRFALVVFTPFGDETRQIAFADDPGVPDISFRLDDLLVFFDGYRCERQDLTTATQYGAETIFFVTNEAATSGRPCR